MTRRRRYLLTLLLCVLIGAGCGGGDWSSGDRVLVAKFLYDSGMAQPHRYDVVVFKFPQQPIKGGVPKNYIKRLLGLPGELLAIFFGRLYHATVPVRQPSEDAKVDPTDLWKEEYLHAKTRFLHEPEGKAFWDKNRFEILRKPLDTMMAMRRIVHDNDHPAKDLEGVLPPRWAGAEPSAWKADGSHGFTHGGQGKQVDWLRYQHVLRPADWPVKEAPRPNDPDGALRNEEFERTYTARVEQIKKDRSKHKSQLITDFLGYNSYQTNFLPPKVYDPHNWVGDLMLECHLKVEKAEGEFCMELAKGVDRFQACWNLQSGECTLFRLGADGKRQELARKSTRLKAAGEYEMRFANIDERLTVWVDRDLPFEDGVTYPPPKERGPTENDLKPASLGSTGAAVQVHKLKLWHDSYYTLRGQLADAGEVVDWSKSETWQPLRDVGYKTLYVQPGHYLCLGDNSPQSSDSREWGTVPERLMLGRALLVYFPFDRGGRIK